ncbi:aldehyde dehydrogenase family protein [Marinilongibacter aquaticus]|uniref:aldehyde dehydrogenase family protein n=1 Tax=Marinilongibacter aquaticus TaxID=2975157 RepID=UPI0021BD0184|nr:aldehyde dehydrogenase family protein [Marinilongibacter aquaticus]UBM59879.1 aldehyde dehydrogenase family protein [Marinilongibacter aquaticus]
MDTETSIRPKETESNEISRLFDLQRKQQYKVSQSGPKERKAKLNRLEKAIWQYRSAIQEALYKDFKKHPSEVDLSEIYPVLGEIRYAKKRLKTWMGTNRRKTPFALLGASSRILYEPKGVVLIISPWNFPFNLSFGPMVSAIAAGNCILLKPSEMTPHISTLMGKILSEIFDECEVAVIQGGVETSTALLKLPFNHIFFTGSPQVGKIVMQAAAQNLCSVTLELGGKSPSIVDETAKLSAAARRLCWGKFLNNGQVCIAPDHLYVHRDVLAPFLEEIKKQIIQFYSEDPSQEIAYNRIVNEKHFERLEAYLKEAVGNGGKVEIGGQTNANEKYIAPTLISNIPPHTRIMHEEIFGPLMPIIAYDSLEEVVSDIRSREKPLALYIFSRSKKNTEFLLSNTRAGGTCINHNVLHFFNPHLGFGGSNHSGIGRGHGDEGFKAFSNSRGILQQHMPNATDFLIPPYTDLKKKLIELTLKWF